MKKPVSTLRHIEVILLAIVFVAGVLAIVYYDYLPGTLRMKNDGFFSGTGDKAYFYPDGSPRMVDHYSAGFLRETRWYARDGRLAAQTKWVQGVGTFFIVDEDGTKLAAIPFVLGRAHGEATYYNRDGTVSRTSRFINGVERPR